MDISSKYGLYSRVYYISDRKIVCGTISKILTCTYISDEYGNCKTKISYLVKRESHKEDEVEERHLFYTKEQLLKSLSEEQI